MDALVGSLIELVFVVYPNVYVKAQYTQSLDGVLWNRYEMIAMYAFNAVVICNTIL